MRILLLSAYADPVGGAEIYMHALRDELARRGHTVGLFGTSSEREVDEEDGTGAPAEQLGVDREDVELCVD